MACTVMADLINPETGVSYRQENNARQHKIPIGTLVEVKFDSWFGRGACWKIHARLWVLGHSRDCDGTPLYSLSGYNNLFAAKESHCLYGGFAEESLTMVEVTEDLKRGVGALEWDREM